MISASSSSPSSASRGSSSSISSTPIDLRRAPQGLEQGLELVRVVMAQPVDEGCGRPVHAAPNATHEILMHPIGVDVLGELLVEQVEVEVERLGVGAKIIVGEVPLVLVQMIVHLPEPAFGRRSFGRLGRLFGVGMRGGDWEVAEDESQLLPHALLDVL